MEAEHYLIAAARGRPAWTRAQVATLLGRSLSSVARWVRSQRLRYDRFEGTARRFSAAELERFLRDDYLAPPSA